MTAATPVLDRVRDALAAAEAQGSPPPGRPTLAATLGVTQHQVRKALETLAHEPPPAARQVEPEPVEAPTIKPVPAPTLAPVDDAPPSASPSARQRPTSGPTAPGTSPGAGLFYLVAAASMIVSVNTSWRYFGDILHVDNLAERTAMFAVLELALIACGQGMRAGVIRHGRPGPARLIAWALCAVSAFMAWQIAGPLAGTARVLLGPLLGLVMLHLALGIEWRETHGQRAGTWARIGREMRERVLSRVGLADDSRDALARTRDRAALRLARLASRRHGLLTNRRMARALAASGVAGDEQTRARMLAELAGLRNLTDLRTIHLASPWRQRQHGELCED